MGPFITRVGIFVFTRFQCRVNCNVNFRPTVHVCICQKANNIFYVVSIIYTYICIFFFKYNIIKAVRELIFITRG